MSPDATPPIQPPDETPLAGVSVPFGGQNAGPQAAPPWEGAAPAPAAVRDAIAHAEGIVLPSLDGVYRAITDTIGSAADPIRRAVAGAERQVKRLAKSADDATAAMLADLAAAGVPVSFSPAERAAEVADPTLTGVLTRVQRILESGAGAEVAGEATADGQAPVAAAETPDEGFVAPGGFAPCGSGGLFTGELYDYPRPGLLPPGKAASGCIIWGCVPGPGGVGWRWVRGIYGWPASIPLPPDPGPPPIPAAGDGRNWIEACPCDVAAAPKPPPPPPPPPAPCEDGVWTVDDSGETPILYAPGGIGTTPVPPTMTVVITSPDGKCYTAELPTVPDPLPPGVRLVPDDQTPSGCRAIHGVSRECPPKPEPTPEPEPTPVPEPTCPAPPKPEPTCPAPQPPIVIPACPVPEKPDEPRAAPPAAGTGAGSGGDGFNLDAFGVCELLTAAARAARPLPGDATRTASGATSYTPGLTPAGWSVIATSAAILPAIAGIELVSTHLAQTVRDHVVGLGLLTGAWAHRPNNALPNASAAMDVGAVLGLASMAEAATGIPLSYMYQSERYYFNWLNPQYIPSQAEIDGMYLADRISGADWECYTKMNGNLPRLAFRSLESRQSTAGPGEVVAARLRGIIPTDGAFLDRMRQIGYIDPARAREQFQLAQYVPTTGEITRYMVRDVFDPRVVGRYEYMSGFDAKFAGKAEDWARANGVTRDVMAASWAAHWEIPSNTALYSMYHRLRPGRLDVRVWDNEAAIHGRPATELALGPRPPVVTEGDIKEAMQVNDIAPGWVNPLLAVSYNPITNTDARRAYMIGFFDFDRLVDAMLDNGYAPNDADTLARFYRSERERSITASTGIGSPRWVLNAYVEGVIDYAQADQQLTEFFPDANVRASQLRKADFRATVETSRAAYKTSVKRFVFGEIDEQRLRTDLGVMGIGLAGQTRIVSKAIASRDGHMKEPRVTQIIEMYVRSQLSRDQAYDRMWRLGYSDEDIQNMLRLGAAKEQERQAVRAAAEANRRRLEAKRNAEGALKLLKDESDRVNRQLDAARKELERLLKLQKETGCGEGGSPGD